MIGFKAEDFDSGATHENSADCAADGKHDISEKSLSAINLTVISPSASSKKVGKQLIEELYTKVHFIWLKRMRRNTKEIMIKSD